MSKLCKKIVAALLVALVLAGCFTVALPENGIMTVKAATSGQCGDNLTWVYDNGTLTISGTGDMWDWVWDDNTPWKDYSEDIKEISIGNGVTSIGDHAFDRCDSLTIINNLPDSITSIGRYAFCGCGSLTSITIPAGVTSIGIDVFYCSDALTSILVAEDNTAYSSVDGVLFNKDKSTLVVFPRGKRGDYIIPDSVTHIEERAFLSNKMTSITIPDSVISIGEGAFAWCRLKNITIPNSVKYIGGDAFEICDDMTSITMPDSAVSLGACAFEDCVSLTDIKIPDGITTILFYTFNNCQSLKSVTIPKSVTHIGYSAFGCCDSLTDVYYGGSEADWKRIKRDNTGWFSDSDIEEFLFSNTDVEAIVSETDLVPLYRANIHYNYSTSSPATAITLDKTTATINKGETAELTATVTPADSTDTVVWTSSDSAVATVSDGTVTAVAPGTCTITATAGSVEATCTVTVKSPATAITLDKTTATINKGETTKLTATVTPADSTDTVIWTTSDSAVATVSDGTVTAVAPGTCTITATAGSAEATCTVTVKEPTIAATAITLDKTTATINKGETAELTATVTPADSTETVVWTTSNSSIATVSNGTVTAVAPGTCTITATAGSAEATCTVTVKSPATAVTLDKTTAKINKGATAKLTATVTPADSTDTEIVWTTSDSAVATVSNGTVTAVDAGTCTITATVGSVKATCSVTVIDKTILPAPIKITVARASINRIKVSWSAVSGASGYYVYRSTDGTYFSKIKTFPAKTKSFTDTKLTCGKTYYYKVIPYNKAKVKGNHSDIKSAKPYPNTPSKLTAKCISNYKIAVKWSPVTYVTGYKLYRSVNGGEYKLYKIFKTKTAYTDTSVVPGVSYSYKVTACKGTGESKKSGAKSAKTKLPAPASLKVKKSATGKINLTWKKVTGASGYKVYRYNVDTGKYECIATRSGNGTASYTDSGLVKGTTYKYKVYAYRTADGLTGLGTATSVKSAKA